MSAKRPISLDACCIQDAHMAVSKSDSHSMCHIHHKSNLFAFPNVCFYSKLRMLDGAFSKFHSSSVMNFIHENMCQLRV